MVQCTNKGHKNVQQREPCASEISLNSANALKKKNYLSVAYPLLKHRAETPGNYHCQS
jgi:hypothetical protein